MIVSLPQADGMRPAPEAATRNACKVCAPLGAAVALKGIEGAIPLLHGSQGCATYIRRYLISHFKEPVDIGSSNFSEAAAVFGGKENLTTGLGNIIRQYRPTLVGVATTCLAETIGDDVPSILRHYPQAGVGGQQPAPLAPSSATGPHLIAISTPAYAGTHMDGYHAALLAVARHFAPEPAAQDKGACAKQAEAPVAFFAPFVSPADLRHLKEVLGDFGLKTIFLPDYADTLDGPAWEQYELMPKGGTSIAALERLPQARAAVQLAATLADKKSAAHYLATTHGMAEHTLPLPIGLRLTDRFFALLEALSGRPTPHQHELERGRLVDAYVDGHKYLAGKRAVIFGEEDLVASLAAFCAEIGITPVLCLSGGRSGKLREAIAPLLTTIGDSVIREDADFATLAELAPGLHPDLLIGSSKGYPAARAMNVPLVRVGFPIHDRFGGQRMLHLGYRGTQQLLDRIANALLEHRQETSDIGYAYM